MTVSVSGKHLNPLFEDLCAKVELPSPVVILSLDIQPFLHDRVRRIPGAMLFTTPEAAVTVRH